MILSLIALGVAGSVFAVVSFALYLFTPPKNYPKNIPTIPFYYALLPLFKDCDQTELYRQYLKEPLEKYGAVKIFFGGRWNIIARRPAFIYEVFKHEDIYAKSGNQVKIPKSLLAEYTGDNIISSHGKNWKLYSSLIKPTLQRDHDPELLWKNARKLRNMLVDYGKQPSHPMALYSLMQRYSLANISECLLGTSFETLDRPDAPLNALQAKIKPIIFNPVFLNFPFLDHLPFKSRQAGRELARSFRKTLRDTIAKSHEGHECQTDSQDLGCRLLGARREGLLTEKQLQDNCLSIFLAGHENPQLCLLSLMYMLGKHKDVQESLRKEIDGLFANTSDPEPTMASIHDLPYLTAVLYEVIRLFPPISQLINRCTSQPINMGGEVFIPAGTYVGYHAGSTNRDVDFWGKDADEFKPSRWGNTTEEIQSLYRRATSKGAFISFHGGRRACLGQKFAMQELRITCVELLRNFRWELDDKWPEKMTPVSFGVP